MAQTIEEIQEEIIEEFSFFEEPSEKIGYIVELSDDLTPLPDEFKTDDYRIKGCLSIVWMKSEFRDGKVYFQADKQDNARIAGGILFLLTKIYSGQSPQEIINSKLFFVDRIGLSMLLTPARSNGLAQMLKQIKFDAIAYQAKGA